MKPINLQFKFTHPESLTTGIESVYAGDNSFFHRIPLNLSCFEVDEMGGKDEAVKILTEKCYRAFEQARLDYRMRKEVSAILKEKMRARTRKDAAAALGITVKEYIDSLNDCF